MCDCTQALSQLNFTGENGVGVASVSSEVVGANTEITFTMTDGSTLGPISIVNGVDGADGADGDPASITSYILDSFIGNPYETLATAFSGDITTKSTIPSNTLIAAGDSVEVEIVMFTADMGMSPLTWDFGFRINNNTVTTLPIAPTTVTMKGTITRVTNTVLYYDLTFYNSTANPGQSSVTISNGFVTVPSLTANAIDLEILVTNNTGQNVTLLKLLTKVTLN